MFNGENIDLSRWQALDLRNQLTQLEAERALSWLEGLASNEAYVADLNEELAATYHAYTGAVVTEIATLRAELSGPQSG